MGTIGQNAAALLASTAMAGVHMGEAPMMHIECGSQFCKALPEIEGGQRVLYMQASSPARDLQNERILTEALMDSKDYFLRFGRIDLDHATVWRAIREKELDQNNPYIREIGRPIDVILKEENGEPYVWVKAEIFQSKNPDNPVTKAADWFWNTLEITPPMIWYPSVAGTIIPGGKKEGFEKGLKVSTINKLRWHSIGLTRTPVHSALKSVNTVPIGAFAKALMEGNCGGAVAVQDADLALNALGINVPEGDLGAMPPGLITPEKLAIIQESIRQNEKSDLSNWISTLGSVGISPQEGLAVLIALFDSSRISGGV